MYTTIEAEIEDGVIRSTESSKIPNHAHVLITLLSHSQPNNTSKKDAYSAKHTTKRRQHPDICEKIKITGDITDTEPISSWNLPT